MEHRRTKGIRGLPLTLSLQRSPIGQAGLRQHKAFADPNGEEMATTCCFNPQSQGLAVRTPPQHRDAPWIKLAVLNPSQLEAPWKVLALSFHSSSPYRKRREQLFCCKEPRNPSDGFVLEISGFVL